MQITVHNVQKRGKALSYRIRFPDDLRHHYDGLNEYSRSLKTKDASMAYSRAVVLNRLRNDHAHLARVETLAYQKPILYPYYGCR